MVLSMSCLDFDSFTAEIISSNTLLSSIYNLNNPRRLDTVRNYVIAHPTEVNSFIGGDVSPFAVACRGCKMIGLDVVKILLDAGADVNACYENNNSTPLIIAAKHGTAELVELLISYGADIHAKNGNGQTALIMSMTTANVQTAAVLLVHGAQIDAQDINGFTALMTLVVTTIDCAALVLLLNYQPDIQLLSRDSRSVLMLLTSRSGNHIEFLSILLDYCPKGFVNQTDSSGTTAIFSAVSGLFRTYTQELAILLEFGSNPNHVNSRGDTPLITACKYARPPLRHAALLIAYGADVNARNKLGRTGLSIALERGNHQVAQLLIVHGAARQFIDIMKEVISKLNC